MTNPEPFNPLAPIKRWTYARKYYLVDSVKRGHLPLDRILQTHGIERGEWETWVQAIDDVGPSALRVTVQSNRDRQRRVA